MQFTPQGSTLVLLVLVFIAFALLIESLYLLWKSHRGERARKLRQRLHSLSQATAQATQARLLKQRALSELPALERTLRRIARAHRLERMIRQAGLDWTVSRLLLACLALGLAAVLAMAALARQGPLFAAVAGCVFAAAPMLYLQNRRQRRLARIEQQLPDALDLITRGLRSGHAFASGLKMAGDEMSEPIAGEFRAVHDEVNFGVSLQDALANFSERVPLTDVRYFVVAVLIQRESGGNLTEILGNLSRLIRDRLKLLARVRVLSSEGRLSAWILGIMPFALAGVINLANPQFMSPLWTDP
ncbi:MAG: type II secretion system F family protein, partial [Ramlibacter sp.]